MAPDIASRIRAKLSRRRHSGTPSLASSRTTASDVDSQSQKLSQSQTLSQSDRVQDHGHSLGVDSNATSQLSARGDTASSQTSRNRSWSLRETFTGDDQPDDRRMGDTAYSDTSSGIGPLDVSRSKSTTTTTNEAQPTPTRDDMASTGAAATVATGTTATATTNAATATAAEPASPRPQGPPSGLTNGPAGNDLHLQLGPPSPRIGSVLGPASAATPSHLQSIHEDSSTATPTSTDNTATDTDGAENDNDHDHDNDDDPLSVAFAPPTPSVAHQQHPAKPPGPVRRQSLLSNRHGILIKTLLHSPLPNESGFAGPVLPIDANMVTRKIWVKRPSASATIITINEDDLVDDVRDMILRKYANSLGRTFDAPDLAIRIHPREQMKDRVMGPEEPMGRTLDAYFPGGQTVDEALIIDIPRRTPKASPRLPVPHHGATTIYYADDGRPSEAGEGYFPPVPGVPSPHLPVTLPAPTNGAVGHSIAVLGTGHIPPIPSPGGTRTRAYRDRPDRPRLGRTHTSSPTLITNGPTGSIAAAANHGMQHYAPRVPLSHSRTHSEASDHPPGNPTPAMPLPTSPIPEPQVRSATPPPRTASPRPSSSRPKKKKNVDYPSLPPGMLNGSVPPISVLIVEDNPINLKLLEAFVKRLKVRWQTAMNGFDAVKKWRTGGFHLVLMDIQLPGMNGLEATKEIRRLERVNSIGVFSSSSYVAPQEVKPELQEEDRLENTSLFKSPVIIVALTASSLQSDRHDALAAGCNDFLTKPVNFVWLERKVMEWGCMQALIDFDGWRQWKDFAQEAQPSESAKKALANKAKSKKNRSSLSSST